MPKELPIDAIDLIDFQWMAARYAHNRRTFAANTVNKATAKLLDAGYKLFPDGTRDAPEATVWVKDGDFGWPDDLIEKYGWDGRKNRETK
jgi:hypothetical protein